jgi:TPR repeat protein
LIFIVTAGAAAAQDIDAALRAARLGSGAASAAWLIPLAEQGNTAAQYALGLIYANGEGVEPDYPKAVRWFDLASRRGHVEARRHLVFMREMGLADAPPGSARPMDGAYRVQVATVPTDADAPREWRRLQRRHPDTLGTLEVVAVAFETPEGTTLYRVQGGPLDEEGARAACARLRDEGTGCLVIRPSGPVR